jgi:hypothetical protein
LLGGSGGATVGLAFVVAHSGAFSSPSVYMTTLSIMLVDRWHVELRASNKKRVWDAVVVDGVYGETFGQ